MIRSARQTLVLVAVGTMAAACVHSDVARSGRRALAVGAEGEAALVESKHGYQEVANLSLVASALATDERLTKHLLRRASLLGCDGVAELRVDGPAAQAICVVRAEGVRPATTAHREEVVVLGALPALKARAAKSGQHGFALYRVLEAAEGRSPREVAWALRWYLSNYPESPLAHDVAMVLVAPGGLGGGVTAAVRASPTK